MKIHVGSEKWNQAAALYIRMQVFVLERGIALTEEFDTDDHDHTVYVVIYDKDKPVATGRYKKMDSRTVRPGRIAVLKEYRKQGLGEIVVKELEALAKQQQCSQSIIHGELTAASFYEKMGYIRESELFYEDGVPCVALKKSL